MLPAANVRMRRDFPQLLAAISAITLLHQVHCEHRDGCVVATISDYEQAQRLLAATFKANAEEGLTPAVRQTIEAIGEAERDVSEVTLRARLDRGKAAISERVTNAIKGGWIVNDEWRQGQPARLQRGDPMPDAVTALPSAEDVQTAFERSVDFRKDEASNQRMASEGSKPSDRDL